MADEIVDEIRLSVLVSTLDGVCLMKKSFLMCCVAALMVLPSYAEAGCPPGGCSASGRASRTQQFRGRARQRVRTQSRTVQATSSVSQAQQCGCGAVCECSQGQSAASSETSVRTVSRSRSNGNYQAWAEREVRLMAERGTYGHVQPCPSPHVGVGVGINGATCMFPGPILAEAHYMGRSCRVFAR